MPRITIDNTPSLKDQIEQWPVRIRRAKKRQLDLAKAIGTHEGHLSEILNFNIRSPRKSTIDKIEQVLKSWQV